MTRREFQRVVQRALDELPSEFQDALHNIDIQVRWRPTGRELREAGLSPRSELFGIYLGIPLPKRTSFYSLVPPDVIIIYQWTHERYCRTEEEMVEQARKTLLHEIGHYLGMDEDHLHDLGMG
jgi:predicted Zn-dependent protease with MMP-like domain